MLIGLLGLVALASCSVKEDRSDCPCWLTVEAESTATLTGWYGSRRIFDGHKGGFVDRMVPRGDVAIISSRGEFTVKERKGLCKGPAEKAVYHGNAGFQRCGKWPDGL